MATNKTIIPNLTTVLGLDETGKAKFKFVQFNKAGTLARFERLGKDGNPDGVTRDYQPSQLLRAEKEGKILVNEDNTISWNFEKPSWD